MFRENFLNQAYVHNYYYYSSKNVNTDVYLCSAIHRASILLSVLYLEFSTIFFYYNKCNIFWYHHNHTTHTHTHRWTHKKCTIILTISKFCVCVNVFVKMYVCVCVCNKREFSELFRKLFLIKLVCKYKKNNMETW